MVGLHTNKITFRGFIFPIFALFLISFLFIRAGSFWYFSTYRGFIKFKTVVIWVMIYILINSIHIWDSFFTEQFSYSYVEYQNIYPLLFKNKSCYTTFFRFNPDYLLWGWNQYVLGAKLYFHTCVFMRLAIWVFINR